MQIILDTKAKNIALKLNKKAYSVGFTGYPNARLWNIYWSVKLRFRNRLFCVLEYQSPD